MIFCAFKKFVIPLWAEIKRTKKICKNNEKYNFNDIKKRFCLDFVI